MPLFTDQTGRTIHLASPPLRIVSLVPSQTELLYALGLEAEVAGITKFCVHPSHWRRTKTITGGTKNIRQDVVLRIKPDLIIAGKEENVQAQVEALYHHAPVWVSDVNNLESALQMIQAIGALTGKEGEATALAGAIAAGFQQLMPLSKPIRVAYLIWNNPYMTIGSDTFIHHLLWLAGFQNAFGEWDRYPVISDAGLAAANPDVVMLSSEPYPFKKTHIRELQQLLPGATILLTDGELLSWYGSRLQHTPAYLRHLQLKVAGKHGR